MTRSSFLLGILNLALICTLCVTPDALTVILGLIFGGWCLERDRLRGMRGKP